MSNAYYNVGGVPATSANLASSVIRAEYLAVQAGFALLPTLSGNSLKIVGVNVGETALTAVATTGTGSVVLATAPTFPTTVAVTGQLTGTKSGSNTTAAFLASAAVPAYAWYESDAAANAKWWDIYAEGGILNFTAINDALNSAVPWLAVTRSGTTATTIAFTGTSLSTTGTISTGDHVGIGNAAVGAFALYVKIATSGATSQVGIYSEATMSSASTISGGAYSTALALASASFTIADAYNYLAADVQALSGGAAITRQHGFWAQDQTRGTNNYGFRGQVSSGVNKYNLYMDGTAANYLAGTLTVLNPIIGLSSTVIPAGGTAGTGLMFSSTANFGTFFGSGAPTLSAAKGSLYLRSDGSGTGDRAYINTNGSTTWTALTTAA